MLNEGGGTRVTYLMCLQGDLWYERIVSAVDTAITVPAGTFDNVYKYDGLVYCYGQQIEYVKPGVGFIFIDRPCPSYPADFPLRRTWLIEYDISN